MDYGINWLSECCDSYPILEVDESTIPYGGATGFCGHCLDTTGFYNPDYLGVDFEYSEDGE